MKILVISNDLDGIFRFRKEIIQKFRLLGWSVIISSPIDGAAKQVSWLEKIGANIVDTKFDRQGKNPAADICLIFYYLKLIKQLQPDVVLSYTIKPNLYGGLASAICKVPQIANITGLGAAVEYPGVMQKITILLYKLCMRRTHLIFFQNASNLDFCLKHNMVKSRTRLIPGSGVDLEYHKLMPFPPENEPIKFIFISRIRKEKGIEEYLMAAIHFFKSKVKTEWHVVGDCEGDYMSRIKDLHNKGVIIYHGAQLDVRPFNSSIHCGIHPTFYPEGMSNVLLEYCATGRAIITTDRPGCREIVDDGINGFIVKQQNAEDLIEKVQKYLDLPYERKKEMGLAARAKVEREFDRQIVVNAYLDAIKSL